MRMQTMAEAAFEFKVLADVCAVGQFYPIPNTPTVAIVPGDAVRWKAVLPSLRRPGEPFRLGIKAEDKWGNPTDRATARLRFEPSRPVDGLPSAYDYSPGRKSVAFEGLSVAKPGVVRIRVLDGGGAVLAESHPLVVREGPFGGYWGDMHGQSGESIGITTARQYFDFARNKSFLDATGPPGERLPGQQRVLGLPPDADLRIPSRRRLRDVARIRVVRQHRGRRRPQRVLPYRRTPHLSFLARPPARPIGPRHGCARRQPIVRAPRRRRLRGLRPRRRTLRRHRVRPRRAR